MVENRAEFKINQLFERMRGLAFRVAAQAMVNGDQGRPEDEGKAGGQHQADDIRVFAGFFETWPP